MDGMHECMDSEGLGLVPRGFIDSPSQALMAMHTQRRKKPNQSAPKCQNTVVCGLVVSNDRSRTTQDVVRKEGEEGRMKT